MLQIEYEDILLVSNRWSLPEFHGVGSHVIFRCLTAHRMVMAWRAARLTFRCGRAMCAACLPSALLCPTGCESLRRLRSRPR